MVWLKWSQDCLKNNPLYGLQIQFNNQKKSPRGRILMSLALKVKSLVFALASKPQVLENCPILGSRTAVFFELKFCRSREKNFWRPLFLEIAWKIFWKRLFFRRTFALVSFVLGLERACPRKGCPWPRTFFVSLASSLVFSTPPLLITVNLFYGFMWAISKLWIV